MNNLPDDTGDAASEAERRLANLNARVKTMRALLVQLLQDAFRAESRLHRNQADQLLEANARLVVSALVAQNDAKAASGALEEAVRVAGRDPLTGLPNRTLLLDRFDSAIFNARRHGKRVALLFVDLDAFKQINDDMGHAAGDRALQFVADCLTSLVRETDTVSRHGGDEFLVLLSEVTHRADATLVADKVNAALAAYGQVNNGAVRLAASIGVSVYPDDGDDAKTLIGRADAAMYLAKRQGLASLFVDGHPPAATASTGARLRRNAWHPATELEMAEDEHEQQNARLREANEALVLAALGAQELLAAAEATKARQAELLAMVANELGDPFAPIRVAATTLGVSGAESMLLSQALQVIDGQADRLSRMVSKILNQQSQDRPDRPTA